MIVLPKFENLKFTKFFITFCRVCLLFMNSPSGKSCNVGALWNMKQGLVRGNWGRPSIVEYLIYRTIAIPTAQLISVLRITRDSCLHQRHQPDLLVSSC